jgi:hypothetical protein
MDRVENSVSHGAPDTNGCLAGEDVWIELKAPTEPKRPTTPLMTSNGNHPLMESQINWFIRQRRAGGIAFILVRTDKRLMLVDGTRHCEAFNSWTVNQMIGNSIFTCSVPMEADNWGLLRNVIYTASRHHRLSGHARAQTLLDDMERKGLAGDRRSR